MIPGKGCGASFLGSFRYAFEGLRSTFKGRNFRIQVSLCLVALLLCALFRTSLIETSIVVIACGLVLAAECFNTALETLVDLVCPEIHPLAKICKDCASAAVLVLSVVSFIIALMIFVPKLF